MVFLRTDSEASLTLALTLKAYSTNTWITRSHSWSLKHSDPFTKVAFLPRLTSILFHEHRVTFFSRNCKKTRAISDTSMHNGCIPATIPECWNLLLPVIFMYIYNFFKLCKFYFLACDLWSQIFKMVKQFSFLSF